MARSASANPLPRLGDFTTDRRVLMLVAMAICVGAGGAVAAWLLLPSLLLLGHLRWLGRDQAHVSTNGSR